MTAADILDVFSHALAIQCKSENVGYILILLDEQGNDIAAQATSNLPTKLILKALRKYLEAVEKRDAS